MHACVLPAWAVTTRHYRQGGLDNRFIYHRSGGCKSKGRVPSVHYIPGTSLAHRWLLSPVCSHGLLSGTSPHRGTSPTKRVPPSWHHLALITSQGAPSPVPSYWRLGLKHTPGGAGLQTLSSLSSTRGLPKSVSSSHAKHVYSIPSASKVLARSSGKSEVPASHVKF